MFADLRRLATLDDPQKPLMTFFSLYRLIDQPTMSALSPKEGFNHLLPSSPPTPDQSKPSKKNNPTARDKTSPSPGVAPLAVERVEWVKGEGMKEIQETRKVVLKECQTWFLKFLDGALNAGLRPTAPTKRGKGGGRGRQAESGEHIADTLSQLKHANDWLDQLQRNLGPDEVGMAETMEGLKQRTYTCLLGHVDNAALALENRSEQRSN